MCRKETAPLTIEKRDDSQQEGVIFSPTTLRGTHKRIEYNGIKGCSPKKAREHLYWLCGLAGGDLDEGRFSLSRLDAHRQGFSAEQFLGEGIRRIDHHSEWSEDEHKRCIGTWVHYPKPKDAPRIRAVSILGEPHEFPRLEDYRINIIAARGANPRYIDIPNSIESSCECPQEWNPSRLTIYPLERSDQEPIERRSTIYGEEILLNNPIESNNDCRIINSNIPDGEQSREICRLSNCKTLQVTIRKPQETYSIKRIELVSLDDLSTSGYETWSITVTVFDE